MPAVLYNFATENCPCKPQHKDGIYKKKDINDEHRGLPAAKYLLNASCQVTSDGSDGK